ncbi:MAG: hypothetical protein E7171_02610 [Firmicutes bacterium]|nr:hypothetical protein [Bacillota bacterium]
MNKKNFKETLFFIALLLIVTIAIDNTFAFIATSTSNVSNTFKPYEFKENDLIINKTVEHPYGEYYQLPNKLLFKFKVNLGSKYANYEFDTSIGKKKSDKDGILEISVKPNEPLTISGIDEGTLVKVTEVQDKYGFAVKDSQITKEITITETGILTISFTNVYTPDPIKLNDVSITGTKVLQDREWREGDKFSFKLEFLNKNQEWETISTKTVEYKENETDFNKFNFNEEIQKVEYDTIGTYYYRISEIIGTDNNIDYDQNINYFSIEITDDDMNGKLELTNIEGHQNITVNNKNIDVTFNNRFKLENVEDLELNITSQKTIKNTGDYEIGPEGFTFILTNTDTNTTTQRLSTDSGITLFGITYTKEDIGKTYNYTLHELNDNKNNITYSDKVYKIQVEIILNSEDKLQAKLRLDGEEVDNIKATFENIYHKVDVPGPHQDLDVEIKAKKTVKNIGDFEISPEGFTFVLTNRETGIEQNRVSDKYGDVTFNLKYTTADVGKTYYFTLEELNDRREYVTYSTLIYNVSVEVYFDDRDKLSAIVKVNDKAQADYTPSFENIYERYEETPQDAIRIDVNITNRMTCIEGCELGPDNFKFRLEEIDTGISKGATSDKHGKASIELKFDKDDIGKSFKYKLYTVDEKKTGITYDTKEYIIDIYVTTNNNNEIVLEIKVDGQEVDSINAIFDQTCYASGDVTPDTGAESELGTVIQALFFSITFFMMLVLLENNRELNKKDVDYITE